METMKAGRLLRGHAIDFDGAYVSVLKRAIRTLFLAKVAMDWHEAILTELQSGKTLLIAAHGNGLRVLVKHLDGISDADIVDVIIPTGVPLMYEYDDALNVLAHYYLSNETGHRAAA
jgi:2,3-bisphosphoglycerate-dependent phosphoglycerate mutase